MPKARDAISEVVRIGIAPMLKTHGFKKKALNEDDSFLGLLESPVGSAFIRDAVSGRFVADDQ